MTKKGSVSVLLVDDDSRILEGLTARSNGRGFDVLSGWSRMLWKGFERYPLWASKTDP